MTLKQLALLCMPVLLWAQGSSVGTVTGVVADPTGAAVPGALVTIRNIDTNSTREMKTGASGVFTVTTLPVGVYELKAAATGFQTTVVKDITLDVNATLRVDVSLRSEEHTSELQSHVNL